VTSLRSPRAAVIRGHRREGAPGRGLVNGLGFGTTPFTAHQSFAAQVSQRRGPILVFFGGGGGLIYLELCRLATHSLRRAAYASAKVLCVSLRQAQRYSSGEAPVPDSIAKLLPALIALGRADVGGPDSRDA
jgi:hypothetical protein